MKKRLTTPLATASKLTKAKMVLTDKDDAIPFESCQKDLVEMHFGLMHASSKLALQIILHEAKTCLAQFEWEVLTGLSDGTSIEDFERSTLELQTQLEYLLGQIDNQLFSNLVKARQTTFEEMSEAVNNLDTSQTRESKSETH